MAYSVALVAQGALTGNLGFDSINDDNIPPSADLMPTRWARLRVTTDTTNYATGGLALNLLGACTGWTAIARWYSQQFVWSSTAYKLVPYLPNHATAGSRLVQVRNVSTGDEHAASASTASVFDIWVSGW